VKTGDWVLLGVGAVVVGGVAWYLVNDGHQYNVYNPLTKKTYTSNSYQGAVDDAGGQNLTNKTTGQHVWFSGRYSDNKFVPSGPAYIYGATPQDAGQYTTAQALGYTG